MIKVLVIAVSGVVLLVTVIVAGDYFGLWGQILITKMEIENIRFRAAEKEGGKPVIDYHIRCSARGSNDICSTPTYQSSPLGEKTVKIVINKTYQKGLIFMHPRAPDGEISTLIRIRVLHPEYHSLVLDMNTAELLKHTVEPVQLYLQPRYQEDVPESE